MRRLFPPVIAYKPQKMSHRESTPACPWILDQTSTKTGSLNVIETIIGQFGVEPTYGQKGASTDFTCPLL
jgi:hypothetical protein